jgi:hypothetical protein
MDACISVRTVVKSSIRLSSHLIPSIEFSPINNSGDEGKLFIHSNPLKHVHIVYTIVTKLSLVERLKLLHLFGATDGNVIAVSGHRNVVMCKIADQPLVSCGDGTKNEDRAESYHPSSERVLEPQLDGPDENTRTYQFLHPAQHLQQQHTTINT